MANIDTQDSLCKTDLLILKREFKQEPVEIDVEDIVGASDEDYFLHLGGQTTEKKELYIQLTKFENVEKINNEKQIKEENGQNILSDTDENSQDEDFNTVSNLHTEEHLVLNFNKSLENQGRKTYKKGKKNCNVAYKTSEVTDCHKELKKVIVTHAPKTVVEQYEFTTLTKNRHICNHCQQEYSNKLHLKNHVKRAHRDIVNMYLCPYCPFKSKYHIKTHILAKHKSDDVNWFQCYICDIKFKLKHQLTRHIFGHLSAAQLGDLMKSCPICEKSFKEATHLNRHIDRVHNKKRTTFKCQDCDYTCTRSYILTRHIKVYHTRAEQRPTYHCRRCEFKTNYQHLLRRHSKKHDPFCCEKCAFVTPLKLSFDLHQITHETNISEHHLKYKCDKCNYKTYRPYSLNVHKLNHLKPDEIQYFYCYHCNFKAKRKDNLKTHVLRHFKKDEVTLQCFICDYKTTNRQRLITHIAQHSIGQTQQPQAEPCVNQE